MSDHAKLSPSKAHRYLACPGSVREEAKYPEEEGGPAAIDGTHSHYILECMILGGLEDPSVAVGKIFKDHEGQFVCDEERAKRVRVAIDYIKERGKELGSDCEVIAESRVNPKHFLGRDDMGGTADVQIHAPSARVLEIIDYKDGMNEVSVLDNPQLELYGLGVLSEMNLEVNGQYPFDTVRLTVIQPKLAAKGLKPINWIEMPISELLGKISKFVVGAMKTDDPNAPLVPGDDHCRYCRAKGCTARMNNVMQAMELFQPVASKPVGEQIAHVADVSMQAAEKDPATMDDQQIRQIMEAAPLMRQLLEAVETEAMRRFKAGQSIPGLKMVHGRGSRSWSFSDEDTAERLMKMGIPKSVVYEVKVISPAKAEKITWMAKRNGTEIKKSLTERQIKTMNTEYVTRMAGKLTVVPESDDRQAVVMNAAPLFGAVQPDAELPAWLK
jgi:hypothetical protein